MLWVGLVLAWVVLGYVVYPLGVLLVDSFQPEERPGFSLENYLNFFDVQRFNYAVPMLNSFLVAIPVVVLTALLGTTLAVLFTRYEFPGRDLLQSLAITPLVMPGFITAYAYLMLYGKFGLVTKLWTIPFGLTQPPFYLDGYWGVVLTETVAELPLAFLTVSAVLSRLDASLEEAALSLGASRARVFFRVVLPLLTPGIAAGGLLILMSSLADFGAPLFMGYETFTVQIFKARTSGETSLAATLSVILTLFSLSVLAITRWYLARRDYLIGGRGSRPVQPIGGWQRLAAGAVVGSIMFVLLLPMFMIVLMSLTDVQRWRVTEWLPPYLTLAHYAKLLQPQVLLYVRNSLLFGLITTVLTAVYGTLVAYLLTRRSFTGRGALDALVTSPYAVPGTVIGIAFIVAFNRPTPFAFGQVLVATAGIIIVSLFVRRSAYVIRSVAASFQQVDASLEEAALSLGASWTYMFRRALVPIVMPGILAGAMLSFVTSVAELSTTILLYTPSTMTIPIAIYIQVYNTDLGLAACLGLVQIAIVVLALLLVNRTIGIRALRL